MTKHFGPRTRKKRRQITEKDTGIVTEVSFIAKIQMGVKGTLLDQYAKEMSVEFEKDVAAAGADKTLTELYNA